MKARWFYVLIVPGVVLILTFLIMPLLTVIAPTFYTNGSLSLSNYIGFFSDEYNLQVLFRSLRISIASAVICAVIGMPAAYFISRCSKEQRGMLIALTLFPTLTNPVVRGFAWMSILGKNGIINRMLMAINLIERPIAILYTESAILIGTVYIFLPMIIVTLIGSMENINKELLDAAESLGAGRLTAFFKVIFPLSLPGLIVGMVLVFTGSLTVYTTPQLLGGNKNIVLVTLLYQKSMMLSDWDGAAVVAAVMVVITILVIKCLNLLAARLDRRMDRGAA